MFAFHNPSLIRFQGKMQETEEMIASAGKDKQLLVEQKEFIVQQIVKGMDTLQVKIEQMSNFSTIFICFLDFQERLKEETTLRKGAEKELREMRYKVEEEIKQLQRKGTEDEERYRLIRAELIDCEVQLKAKDKEIDEIQVGISSFTCKFIDS